MRILTITLLLFLIVGGCNYNDKDNIIQENGSSSADKPEQDIPSTAPPETPQNLSVRNILETKIYLSWDTVDNATGYKIYYSKSLNNEYIAHDCGNGDYYCHENLEYNTTYYYRISAYNDYGESKLSQYVEATTLNPFFIKPQKPNNIKFLSVTHDTIGISWDEVYNALKYKIYMNLDPFNNTYPYVYYTENTNINFIELQSSQYYCFKINSYNYAGECDSFGDDISTITQEAYGIIRLRNISIYHNTLYADGNLIGGTPAHTTRDFDCLAGYRDILVSNDIGTNWETYEYLQKDQILIVPYMK